MPRARTRSSCSPTTGRRRARPSSSATATGSTSWSTARSAARTWSALTGGDEQDAMVEHAVGEATGRKPEKRVQVRRLRPRRGGPGLGQPRARLSDGAAAAAHARGDRGAPSRAAARPARAPARRLGARPLVRARRRRARRRGGARYLDEDRVEGEDPLAHFSPTAAQHLLRTDGFEHVADIMVGSFYDPTLDEGCAFEELISFHGGLGGPQTRPFILSPPSVALPDGAADRRRRGPRPAARVAAGASEARGRPAPGAGCGAGARGRSSRAGST